MPSFAAPRASAWLFALGATVHGAMRGALPCARTTASSRRRRIHAGRTLAPSTRASRGGVRNELVQLTVVPPPTQRPCRMLIALSAVLRPRIPGTGRDTLRARACGNRATSAAALPRAARRAARRRARISAAVPPPAPLPTMTTSASSVDVALGARGVDHAPAAAQSLRRIGDRRSSCVVDLRRPRVADRRPRACGCRTTRRTSAGAARRMRRAFGDQRLFCRRTRKASASPTPASRHGPSMPANAMRTGGKASNANSAASSSRAIGGRPAMAVATAAERLLDRRVPCGRVRGQCAIEHRGDQCPHDVGAVGRQRGDRRPARSVWPGCSQRAAASAAAPATPTNRKRRRDGFTRDAKR